MNISRPNLRVSIALLALFVGAPCEASNADPNKPQTVVGAELSKTLVGATLNNVNAAIRENSVETFCPANRWLRTGHRADAYGSYTIKTDQFCVDNAGTKGWCRRLVRDGKGQYFTEEVSVPSRPPAPVVIAKTPVCG